MTDNVEHMNISQNLRTQVWSISWLDNDLTQLKIWKWIFQYLDSITWILWVNPRKIFPAFIPANAKIWTTDLRRWSQEDLGRNTRKILQYRKKNSSCFIEIGKIPEDLLTYKKKTKPRWNFLRKSLKMFQGEWGR